MRNPEVRLIEGRENDMAYYDTILATVVDDHVNTNAAQSINGYLIETSVDETEGEQQQLLYCVPALAEFCCSPPPPTLDDSNTSSGDEIKPTMESTDGTPESTSTVDTANRLAPFLPSVTEFAADMESLLGGGSRCARRLLLDREARAEELHMTHQLFDELKPVFFCGHKGVWMEVRGAEAECGEAGEVCEASSGTSLCSLRQSVIS
ncbi:hypothetical protein BHE74_00038222 [Ensete ventricosum]|nr:hypothetical protein BHE74_00038222 [Ensete ventricosum]RZS18089.1 hypothetical protein BHM03_00050314 [Ensete ventricosum]